MKKQRFFARLIYGILMLTLMSTFSFAADTDDPGMDDENFEPAVKTVVSAWDILRDSEEDVSCGSDEEPADVLRYIAYEIDEEKEAEIDRQVKEADEKAKAAAGNEALALAKELVENGRYRLLIGEENSYEKYDDDFNEDNDDDFNEDYDDDSYEDEDDPEEVADYENTDEEDTDEEDLEYFNSLAQKYPAIIQFWFDSEGHYYYDYDVDYDGIDFDSIYYQVPHDTFHVEDNVKYENFKPGAYNVKARLILLDESEEGVLSQKSEVREIESGFTVHESAGGEVDLDFGDLQLDPGRYVITLEITDSEGQVCARSDDLNNNCETLMVREYSILDEKATNSLDKMRGEGFIEFSVKASGTKLESSPPTGDKEYILNHFALTIISLLVIILLILLKSEGRYRRHE